MRVVRFVDWVMSFALVACALFGTALAPAWVWTSAAATLVLYLMLLAGYPTRRESRDR